jgi:hypothetical protein
LHARWYEDEFGKRSILHGDPGASLVAAEEWDRRESGIGGDGLCGRLLPEYLRAGDRSPVACVLLVCACLAAYLEKAEIEEMRRLGGWGSSPPGPWAVALPVGFLVLLLCCIKIVNLK